MTDVALELSMAAVGVVFITSDKFLPALGLAFSASKPDQPRLQASASAISLMHFFTSLATSRLARVGGR